MTQTSKSNQPAPGQYLALQLRAKGASESGGTVISGVANDSGTTDSYGTRIKVSQRALDSFMANPVLLYNHDVHNPIGTVRSIAYHGGELRAEAEIHPDARTPTGANIAELVRSGVLRAFSVRIDECKETRTKDHIQLDADALDELSIVTLPSNRPSLFQMRSKGIEIHGAEELIEDVVPVVELRSEAVTRAAGVLSLDLLTQRLRKLVCDEKGDDYWSSSYLVSVYDDFCVWTSYHHATFYRQGYSVDGAGVVTLTGAEQEVLPSWIVVGEAGPDEGERSKGPQVRLHPDDLAEIVRQVREPVAPAVLPPTDPPAEVSLDDARAAIRSTISSVICAPVG